MKVLSIFANSYFLLKTLQSIQVQKMSLEEKFQSACQQIKKFAKRPTDAEMLEVYSLYKQATVGDNNIAKPSDVKAKAKWESWNGKKGLNSNSAKEQYINKVKALSNSYA